ncbi:MAG: C69 family dipeptidase [Bacteroidales bacterium]|nr:C69 family dipeptidase [Bacteroidales bacterium]
MNRLSKFVTAAAALLLCAVPSGDACTSIMVGKKASSDGSVMTAHCCDSYYRTYVTIEPRKTFQPGETEPYFFNVLHKEEPWDPRGVYETGRIVPPALQTYRFVNTAYPCMNEKQLAIGETTYDGNKDLINRNGVFWIEELERLALQYCDNARDAIRLMGEMAEKYGYADWGETLTVADPNEVWQFEINGPGPGEPGAIWAAQRIPDDHVGISANIARIGAIDFNDPDHFMYCKDLKKKAKALGLWDGKGPLKFWKVVGDANRKPFSVREWFVLSTLAPSLGLSLDDEEIPFSVKPEVPVTPERILAFYRETYEGTELDMGQNLKIKAHRRVKDPNSAPYPHSTYTEYDEVVTPVSNWMSADMRNMLNQLAPGTVTNRRTIAVIQCSYSWIAQCRDWLPNEVGGVLWFAFDNPGQSPRFPIYAGATQLPVEMGHCGQNSYRPEAAVWAFRETNRIATIYWDKTRKVLEPEQALFEQMMFEQDKALQEKVKALPAEGRETAVAQLLNDQTNSFYAMVSGKWRELKGRVLEIFVRSM